MKKIIFTILIVFIFVIITACAPTDNNETEDPTVVNTVTNDSFSLSIWVTNSLFGEDEPIEFYATLTNLTTEEITVLHADPLVVFSIKGEPYFHGDWARQDSLNRTVFAPEEEVEFAFQKSGGWSSDDPNAEFYKLFYSEKDLILPPGDYTLTAQVEYSTDENDMRGTMKTMEASLNIKVDN